MTARDAHLAHVRDGQSGAIATITDPALRRQLQQHADAQLAAIRSHFINACRATPNFDAACFDDHNQAKRHDPACLKLVNAIDETCFKALQR